MRRNIVPTAVLVGVLGFPIGPRPVRAQTPSGTRQAEPPPACQPAPAVAQPRDPTGLRPAKPEAADRPLPINLAPPLRPAAAPPPGLEAALAAVPPEDWLFRP